MSKISTAVEGFTIREAASSDVSLILQFIKNLAEYEKKADEVQATESDLSNRLFGPHPFAEVIIGEYQGAPAGFALFFYNFSTFKGQPGLYLEDIFVDPEHRGRSIGRAMMVYLARLARSRGCARFEWSVLNWNEPAIGFYRNLGAEPKEEWDLFQLSGAALETLAG